MDVENLFLFQIFFLVGPSLYVNAPKSCKSTHSLCVCHVEKNLFVEAQKAVEGQNVFPNQQQQQQRMQYQQKQRMHQHQVPLGDPRWMHTLYQQHLQQAAAGSGPHMITQGHQQQPQFFNFIDNFSGPLLQTPGSRVGHVPGPGTHMVNGGRQFPVHQLQQYPHHMTGVPASVGASQMDGSSQNVSDARTSHGDNAKGEVQTREAWTQPVRSESEPSHSATMPLSLPK